MRNRELGLYWVVATSVSAVGIAATAIAAGAAAGFICAILCLALSGWGFAFTLWRYREIRKLSTALSRAAAQGQVLDLRSNREGELSILQNDIYKITSALAGQADHLRQDKRFLADSLSDISHQLKTPLTSLLVHSDLLQNEDLPAEKRRAFLQSISLQLERIRWLVSSLLKLSRIDAAVVDFKNEPVALHRLLSQTAEPLLPLAEQRRVALSIDCSRELQWQGDAEWTREALGNLLKNCIEHTPVDGNVAIRCIDNPLHTSIVIQDNGTGFSDKDLPRLFERFYRGQAGADTEGVGIGLAMAKSILQAQRADVLAENAEEGGARFIVKLYKAS